MAALMEVKVPDLGDSKAVPIIEILDHHKLGGFSSDTPILFWNNPVGSTSTIVSLCYQQLGIPVPAPIAGLLMSGIVADTLNLTSPTTTPIDCSALDRLSRIAGPRRMEAGNCRGEIRGHHESRGA